MLAPVPTLEELRTARGVYTPAGRGCSECGTLHRHGFVAGRAFLCADCYLVFLGDPS